MILGLKLEEWDLAVVGKITCQGTLRDTAGLMLNLL